MPPRAMKKVLEAEALSNLETTGFSGRVMLLISLL